MKLKDMQSLFIHELKDLHSAERQLVKALPKMAKGASDPSLREAFEEHKKQTEEHVKRLERIFEELEASPRGPKCEAMEGLIEEGSEFLDSDGEDSVRDAALIAAAQRVEHYEIAAYGSARTFARQLGFDKAADLLQQTLDEEGETDKKLTQLAESRVNVSAPATA